MKDPIISVSGLRGVIGESLSPQLAMHFSCAFAGGLPSGSVVVTRDGRSTGEMLSLAIQSGLSAIGRNVIDAGIAATPTTGVLVRQYDAVGGIQISASHNPPEYNGIKLFSPDGQVISAEQGEAVVNRYREGAVDWAEYDQLGQIELCSDTTNRHLELVLALVDVSKIRDSRFRVLLDSNHGAGSLLGRRLLDALGCEVTFLGDTPDGAFEHPPEPTADNLQSVGADVRRHETVVGFCQDPDADRLALIDERGNYVGEEYTLAVCLDHVLRSTQGPVVTNCATSRMNEEIAKKYGCSFSRSAVGEANVVAEMGRVSAVFGGEGNGGPISPEVGFVRDSFVGMALVLDALANRRLPLSELAAELPRFEIVKTKAGIDRAQLDSAFRRLIDHFSDAQPDQLDGLRLDWDDSWLLVRPSNTEPIVRIIAESPTRDAAQSLCDQAAAVLRG